MSSFGKPPMSERVVGASTIFGQPTFNCEIFLVSNNGEPSTSSIWVKRSDGALFGRVVLAHKILQK